MRSFKNTGEFRYSHLIPPGYKDKKELNRYGDVVIWHEMLEDLSNNGDDHPDGTCILISCDEKTDWISGASLVQGEKQGIQKPNKSIGYDVVRPHPLLTHELTERSKINNLLVLHPRFLAMAIERSSRLIGQANTLSALHAALFLHVSMGAEGAQQQAVPSNSQPLQKRPMPAMLEKESSSKGEMAEGQLGHSSIHELMSIAISNDVRAYLGSDIDEQMRQRDSWISNINSGSLDPFRLGLLLAELVSDRPEQWLVEGPNVIEECRRGVGALCANRVMLGFAASAYFGRQGDLLASPRLRLASIIFVFEKESWLNLAFEALHDYLVEAEAMLPYLPGGGVREIAYSVDTLGQAKNKPRTLVGVRVGGYPVLIDQLSVGHPRRLSALFTRAQNYSCSGKELRSLIAHELAIPVECLNENFDKVKYAWSPDAGLAVLDASLPGGLSCDSEWEEG